MISFFVLIFAQIILIKATWYPWVGQGMKSLVRGTASESQSFTIQYSEFTEAAYTGFFKFNTVDPFKWYSLMKLQVKNEGFTFLHYYTRGLIPYLKIQNDETNYVDDNQIGPAILVNVWFQIGFGYRESIKRVQAAFTYNPYSAIINYPYATTFTLNPRIKEFELCISCQPQEYLYTKFDGIYSSIKMLIEHDPTYVTYKFLVNEGEMDQNLLRESFSGTANVLAFVKSQYVPNSSVICTDSTKFYYDGFCIEKSECKNVIYYLQTKFGEQNSVFWNTNTNICDTCQDNCQLCDSNAICQQCKYGYSLDSNNNICKKCSSGTFFNPSNQLCVTSCPSNYQKDYINQVCVNKFNAFFHLLNPILVQRNFILNEGFNLIDTQNQQIQSDQFSQCYLDNNSFGPYTFLGGLNTLKTHQLNKKILGLPKNYKKVIMFQAIIYNNGIQGDFNLLVNNNLITLASYQKIFSNQKLCIDNNLVSLYELRYIINDSSTDLDINIFTSKNGWGIRNFSMNITKCHSTCLDCTTDGNPWSCTSCDMQLTSILVNNNCSCKKGQYTKYLNCYSSPCYSCSDCPPNCISCEDQTGKCTSCTGGYSVQNGLCILNNFCSVEYKTDPGSSYCIRSKDYGLSLFINDRIVPNMEFWKFTYQYGQFCECHQRKYPSFFGSINTAKFTYSLQNYQLYHYQIEINLSATNIDNVKKTDFMNYYIDNTLVKSSSYGTDSTTSYCYSAAFGEEKVQEVITYQKKSQDLIFLIEARLTTGFYAFNDFILYYIRCHASCSNCTIGNSCSQCIQNASQDATKGNFCYCNAGYYFTYDWSNSSGICIKCNPFCKTCNGPNITDCLTCQESYKLDNNLCVNACNTNQLWDWSLHKCLDCSDCCATCTGTSNNECSSCYTDYMTLNSSVCKFNTNNMICNSCNTNVVNSLCGGTHINHDYCLSRGWVSFNDNTCIYCNSADSNGNCGGSSQYNNICNQFGYFYSSVTSSCLSCAQAIGTDCGEAAIRNMCSLNKWIYGSLSTCINCKITDNPLCCHSTCNTCNGQYDNNCLSCYGSQILFNGYCIDKCPNGFKLDPTTNTCSSCPKFIGVSECNNCSADCYQCAAANITNCKKCSNSRILDLVTNRCKCQDEEDSRPTFYECSISNQAVLDIKLLNSAPKMTIDFGKLLLDLPGFVSQENSNNVCKAIFDQTNLNLIGINSVCQIQFNIINIELDQTATIMHGDFLNFIPNVLKFKINSSVYIDTFLNNVVFQEAPSNTAVVFIYNKIENTCNNYTIQLDKILNDSKRGFKSITWTLMNPISNQGDIEIQSILSIASSLKQTSIIIPKGIIPINVQKNIKVEYLLKNTFAGSQSFLFQVKTYKSINLSFQTDMKIPYYRFQDFKVSLTYYIQYCDEQGNQINEYDLVDISITSSQSSLINTELKSSTLKEVSFQVNKFTFPSNNDNEINAVVTTSKDLTVTSSQKIQFKTEPSTLIVKIEGGNRKTDYKSQIHFVSTIRDLDVEDETINQGIKKTWNCSDPSDFNKKCLDQESKEFELDQNNPIIPPRKFSPYTVIKISLKGEKDIRSTTDIIVVLFIEFDLPILDIKLKLIDPFAQTINLNEEIFTVLNYDTQVNPDILSFSSTIVYENDVVGAIKFAYTKLKFQLWDHFSGFKRTESSVTIRFSVFNPYYFMPSISIVSFKINFPPNECVFSISPMPNATNFVYSLQTIFTLSMSGCIDDNLPLSYQFFMYKQQEDIDFEIKNPQQAKRRQLNNQSPDSTLLTILPAGNLIIMAVSSDSLQAVYNATISLQITRSNMNENQYIDLIDNALNLNGKTNDEIISQLSLISEDLCKRTDLSSSSYINTRKIQIINTLKSTSEQLTTFSTFSSLSDKSISSILQSGIKLDTTEQTTQLNSLVTSLAEDWTTIPYEKLPDNKKSLRNQQIFDYFQILDSIVMNSSKSSSNDSQLEIDISSQIGQKMNYNSLPNEDPKIFQGEQIQIESQQVTEKNLCRHLNCNDEKLSSNQKEVSSIYNMAFKTHKQNPYKNDLSYQNFTTQLKQNIGTSQPTVFPVINPSIIPTSTTSPTSPLYTNNAQFTFKGEEKEGLSCFNKNNGSWTSSGCKLVFNKKNKLYSCFCESLNPTTIVDDLDALIKNKNLATAFGQQGLDNISNFTNFYEYIAFWLIVGKTIGFGLLYLKGRSLDSVYNQTISGQRIIKAKKRTNQVYPIKEFNTLQDQDSQHNIIQLSKQQSSQPSQDIETAKLKPKTESRPRRKVCKMEDPSTFLQINNKSNNQQSSPVVQYQSFNLNEQTNQKNEVQNSDPKSKQLDTKRQIDQKQEIHQFASIEIINSSPEFKDEKTQNQGIMTDNSPQTMTQNLSSFSTKTDLKKKTTDLSDREYSQKTKKFIEFNLFKQIIFFHNFFGIFLVYDQNMPRNIRFTCFYVRLIHSFAVSIIFDQTYSLIQLIALSIANSVLIMICLTLIQIISKKLGKFVIGGTLLCLLGFYYYVILSIVSGQKPYTSNKSMISYTTFTSIDLFVVSFISAIFQRILAIRLIQRQKLQSCYQKIFELLHIQLILSSIL